MLLTEGNKQKEYENHPAGTHAATLIQIVDLGQQDFTKDGVTSWSRKILFVWESVELMSDGRPFTISREFGMTLNSKGNLRPFLEGWRGRSFTSEELAGFNPMVLIGMPCLLSVVEAEGKDGKKYANVNSAMRLPKGMEVPKIVNETLFFSLAEFDIDVFNKLTKRTKEKIMKSPEYQSLNIEGHLLQKEQDKDLHDDQDVAF